MASEIRLVALCTVLFSGCAAPSGEDDLEEDDRSGPGPSVHYIDVDEDGHFYPSALTVDDGDLVVWRFHDRFDSLVRIKSSSGLTEVCNQAAPYVYGDPFELTGPMPVAAGGIFVLNPSHNDKGLVVVDEADADDPEDPCGEDDDHGHVGTQHLCAKGEPAAAMDSTWADPGTSGVFIRLDWVDLNPAEGVYTLDVLEREVRKAVENGKLYSLAIGAGKRGTPDWIFNTSFIPGDPVGQYVARPGGGGGVPRVHLQDHADHPEEEDCGFEMDLGLPSDEDYQEHYFAMLSAVADLLKSRASWYRALAYIKPSGANMLTAENRLPKHCEEGCRCNTEAWSNAGYRPRYLYDFYRAQHDHLVEEFPGKTLSYQVIHDGFPRINGVGGYVNADGVLTAGTEELGATVQTQNIIDEGFDLHDNQFAVQHNGLHPEPPYPYACPGADDCPNNMVRIKGNEGRYIAYQTQNTSDIWNLALLDSALENAADYTTAGMIEIYEERLWEAQQATEGPLSGSGGVRTLGDWDEFFRARRSQTSAQHLYIFANSGPANKTIYYIHGSKCDPDAPHYASITVRP